MVYDLSSYLTQYPLLLLISLLNDFYLFSSFRIVYFGCLKNIQNLEKRKNKNVAGKGYPAKLICINILPIITKKLLVGLWLFSGSEETSRSSDIRAR